MDILRKYFLKKFVIDDFIINALKIFYPLFYYNLVLSISSID